ncbi:MAG: hypothetical protein KGH60_00150 [Candidatus Micrarchaeota archaeon]|nr:hypothetical protein [Candidatus Micrarchaeota archaeon]
MAPTVNFDDENINKTKASDSTSEKRIDIPKDITLRKATNDAAKGIEKSEDRTTEKKATSWVTKFSAAAATAGAAMTGALGYIATTLSNNVAHAQNIATNATRAIINQTLSAAGQHAQSSTGIGTAEGVAIGIVVIVGTTLLGIYLDMRAKRKND